MTSKKLIRTCQYS